MAPGPKARRVRLSPSVRQELEALSKSATAPFRSVQRARIVLHAAEGLDNVEIARRVGTTDRTVREWRNRFAKTPSASTLEDRGRSGRPARVPVHVRCELIKLACRPPSDAGVKLRNVWTQEVLRQALLEETGVAISRSEVCRILQVEDLRPHKMRVWLHSPDPEFRTKVKRICDLYLRPPAGSTVVCVDEKTCIQAVARKHPTKPAQPGSVGKFEFEYIRRGTKALIGAFDVRTGEVFGQVRTRRTAADLMAFMEALAKRYPVGEVYVVWDNLNIHCGRAWAEFNERHGGRFKFVYTPKHASWVNQIEIWFGILQRRVLTYGEFANPNDLKMKLEAFIAAWNEREAHPFRWTFRGRFQHRRRAA